MHLMDFIQILVLMVVVILVSPLLGRYIAFIYQGNYKDNIFLLNFVKLENAIYKICSVDPLEKMNWKQYLSQVLLFNFVGFIFLFCILIFQHHLPLNPEHMVGVSLDLAFNIAASFVTNTNWQSYYGETTLSYFSQMLGLTTQNFLSAATGLAVTLPLIRGFMNKEDSCLGNFWQDLIRSIVYILLPLSILLSIFLLTQGVIQTLNPYQVAETIEKNSQIIPLGPVASQVAIKQLGTNGGGYFGANSAHPFENPTTASNFFQHLSILLIPAALCFTFGCLIKDRRQGLLLFNVMLFFWVFAVTFSYFFQTEPNNSLNITDSLEGIETRFDLSNSVFWTMSTTDTGSGSTNSSIGSLMPLTSGIALFNIMLGQVIFGGVGVGLCTMLKYVLLSVFIAGLMVGRTPEYLGKKIEKKEILYVVLAIFIPSTFTLAGTGLSFIIPEAASSIGHQGPHGFTEMLYAFTSAVGNNGSSINSFAANTPYYNLILGFLMLTGRLFTIITGLAIAGSVTSKRFYPRSKGTLGTDTALFGVLLVGVIITTGALSFFPALILGPIFEHLLMVKGEVF